MERTELDRILESHRRWLEDPAMGQRADVVALLERVRISLDEATLRERDLVRRLVDAEDKLSAQDVECTRCDVQCCDFRQRGEERVCILCMQRDTDSLLALLRRMQTHRTPEDWVPHCAWCGTVAEGSFMDNQPTHELGCALAAAVLRGY